MFSKEAPSSPIYTKTLPGDLGSWGPRGLAGFSDHRGQSFKSLTVRMFSKIKTHSCHKVPQYWILAVNPGRVSLARGSFTTVQLKVDTRGTGLLQQAGVGALSASLVGWA